MSRKGLGLLVLMVAAGVVMGQAKDKEKDKKDAKEPPKVKAVLVKVDAEKKKLTVTMNGKKMDVDVGKDVEIVGPRGGKSDGLKDDRLTTGAELGLMYDGKVLKKIYLPVRKADKDKGKDKGKEKDGKGKDKDAKPKEKDGK